MSEALLLDTNVVSFLLKKDTPYYRRPTTSEAKPR